VAFAVQLITGRVDESYLLGLQSDGAGNWHYTDGTPADMEFLREHSHDNLAGVQVTILTPPLLTTSALPRLAPPRLTTSASPHRLTPPHLLAPPRPAPPRLASPPHPA
jgi:hypothetical protein